jgi:hypothetical protein
MIINFIISLFTQLKTIRILKYNKYGYIVLFISEKISYEIICYLKLSQLSESLIGVDLFSYNIMHSSKTTKNLLFRHLMFIKTNVSAILVSHSSLSNISLEKFFYNFN